MQFIVIETWENLSSPYVCTTEDGDCIYFDSFEQATDYSDENCQDGLVVPMNQRVINFGIENS